MSAATVPAIGPGYRSAQWSMLFAVMFCYLFFYAGRQNLGFAVRGMQDDLAFSATTIAILNSALLLGYGLGQAITGNLADIYGARTMVTIGAVCSVALNWAFSFSSEVGWAALLWGLNGLAQSTAWPAMNRLLANWWPRHERGKAIGFYLLSAGFSSSLTFALCILVLQAFPAHDGWRWIFRLPVSLIIVGAVAFLLFARNRPEDLGYPPLPPETQAEPAASHSESSVARYRRVLANRQFLLACLSIGCESLARYGLLNWVPVHFLGPDWRANPGAGWITMGLPLGMAAGALSAGLAADRWFPDHRARMVFFLMGAAAAATLLLPVLPLAGSPFIFPLLAVAGFLVYAPQASYWALCPALVGRHSAGTATGLMDASAYAFAAAGQLIIGRAIDITHSTAAAFYVIGIACILGALLILPVRK